MNASEISNYFKKSKTSLSNYPGPLGKTCYKQKHYLKKLNDGNVNPRFAASKVGSVLGGLLCGMHNTKVEALETQEDLEEVQDAIVDAEIEEPEDQDEITFVGETES